MGPSGPSQRGPPWGAGFHIPCAFRPSTYVRQSIRCLAISPDVRVVAAACESGQVYIWRRVLDEAAIARGDCGSGWRLESAALSLSGWLGPEEVISLDFCGVPGAAQLLGLPSELLLVCLLPDGRLRLLDPSDGRCVAVVPCPQQPNSEAAGGPAGAAAAAGTSVSAGSANAAAASLAILEDGRHAAMAGACDPVVVDLLTGRLAMKLRFSSESALCAFATPRRRRLGACAAPPPGSGSMLQLAAVSGDTVFVWHLPTSFSASSDAGPLPVLSFVFARGYGRLLDGDGLVALALESGLLMLSLHGRLLLWLLGDVARQPEALAGSPPLVDTALVDGAGAELLPLGLRGGAQLQARNASSSKRLWTLPVRCRRAGCRSWSPPALVSAPNTASSSRLGSNAEHAQAKSSALLVVAWTQAGRLLCGKVDLESGAGSLEYSFFLHSWGQAPLGCAADVPACFRWCSNDESLIALVVGAQGDTLHMGFALTHRHRPHWRRAACLADLWGLVGETGSEAEVLSPSTNATVASAALVEVRGAPWVAMGFSNSGRPMCAVPLTGDAQAAVRLPVPNDVCLGEPCCLVAVTDFLAAGDDHGLVCWWALPDWSFAGHRRPLYDAPVVHMACVWGPRHGANAAAALVPVPALLVSLDFMGRCEVIDLKACKVTCVLQSQSGPSFWLEEPLRFMQDSASCYIFAATPSKTCVWDAESGAFERSVPSNAGLFAEADASAAIAAQGNCTPGLRCPALAAPGFGGGQAVNWRSVSASRAGLGTDVALCRLGEVMLDGPLWRLPVLLVSPSAFLVQSSASAESADHPSPETAGTATAAPSTAAWVEGGPCMVDNPAAPMPWLVGSRSEALCAQLQLMSRAAGPKTSGRGFRRKPSSPFVVGAFGVDESLSFPLPHWQRSLAPQSAPSSPRRSDVRGGADGLRTSTASSSVSTPQCLSSMSESVLRSLEDRASSVRAARGSAQRDSSLEPAIQLELVCGSCPQAGLELLARLLLHAEALPALLQRCAFPALRRLLAEASPAATCRAVSTWMRVLRLHSQSPRSPAHDASLRNCAFGSPAALSDAAAILMAMVAHAQGVRRFERSCGAGATELVTQALCARMFARSCGRRMQSLACEAFAMGFALWRQHLPAALPKKQSGAVRSRMPSGVAGAGSSPTPPAAQPPPPPSSATLSGVATNGPPPPSAESADRSPSPERARTIDEDLEWLAVQVLALSQEPSLAQSCFPVMMQVGAADPVTLLVVMGKAARRTDMGPAYASSALFTLVAFIHRCSGKVLPLLPRFTEVVLRCLEPSDPTLRRQSLMAVTSALHQLVQTFPMVAFHQTSQKFAVGTGDGLVVIYDLRTATKWRILEGHSGAIAALAFSKDGSKLGSYSSQDGSVRMWQCSTQGLLGGLLGSGGRCLKAHRLPPQALDSEIAGLPLATRWRDVSMAWTEQGAFRLVRESGDTVHFKPE